ncbi:gag-pol polyprotein [Cucumis melo var. makuwa]|uniref:Gag-pol polyprotein n=1 Tax=Cucumis melo var. makuwa TaxID=1194695 RepID=A0A5A7VIL5_CUCMM|nr:gag-pol polyprotein [Cucumis melo var. makuwa]TYK26287.1 gag-pol polyprotein [Cucumis melo var. makuwa]
MLNSRTENLGSILKARHNGSHRYGLGFVASTSSSKATSEIKFVPASIRVEYDTIHIETGLQLNLLGELVTIVVEKWVLQTYVTGHITFGEGAKGNIIAKLNRDKDDLPRLNDVRKLGHVSMRELEKVIKNKEVVGISDLDVNGNFYCGDCQIGKKTRSTHKSLKECYTNRVLELLHMDLMGPMQTESLGGKRYVLVVVDDYSRYTWKWDVRSEQEIFLGYSQNSWAYRVYNNRSDSVMETINVTINDLDSAIKQMNDEEDETLNMSEVRTMSTVEESKAIIHLTIQAKV